MKIYQVNVVCTGSTGRIAADISHYVEQHGGQCRIVYGRGDEYEGIDAFKIETKWGGRYCFKDKPGILLTFDDGLTANASVAAPLLKKYGFTGLFSKRSISGTFSVL